MYNHNNAQQSKNRVHISWDILYMPLRRQQRTVIAKLHSGTLPLLIETGRYKQIPRPERVCRQCDMGAVEDESHFLFYCQAYDNRRQRMYDEHSADPTNVNTYLIGDNATRSFAQYIIDCFEIRR